MRAVLLGAATAGLVALGLAVVPAAMATPGYANCDQAKAHGDVNIPRTSPNYRPELDGDHDGYACDSGEVATSKGSAMLRDGDSSQVGNVPKGSVDTGDGSTAGR